MKNNIKSKLDELQYTDIYSLILFALYKLKDIPEYSTLSELVYLVNKDSLFNLLEYYAGMTIKIPSKEELSIIINTLLLYQFTVIEHKEFSEAIKLLDIQPSFIEEIKNLYIKIIEILDKYDFKRN